MIHPEVKCDPEIAHKETMNVLFIAHLSLSRCVACFMMKHAAVPEDMVTSFLCALSDRKDLVGGRNSQESKE